MNLAKISNSIHTNAMRVYAFKYFLALIANRTKVLHVLVLRNIFKAKNLEFL